MKLRKNRKSTFLSGKARVWFIIAGIITGIIILKSTGAVVTFTSSDKYSCHIHPVADQRPRFPERL
jgi:hypothetical protein